MTRMLLLLVLAQTNAAAFAQQTPPSRPPSTPGDPNKSAGAIIPPPEILPHCLELIKQKRHEEARRLLIPVVSQHPDWPRANFYLALTYHRENRYEQARDLFK